MWSFLATGQLKSVALLQSGQEWLSRNDYYLTHVIADEIIKSIKLNPFKRRSRNIHMWKYTSPMCQKEQEKD